MYVAIRRMKVKPGELDEVVRRIESGFVPLLRRMPGFVKYLGVQVGEDEDLTISVFETQAQAEANSSAAEWVKAHLAPLAAGPHEIVAVGEVRVRQTQ